MDQGSSCNSWLTRTKFSHTVWHRLDCSGTPISLESLRSSRFPTRPSDDPRDASGPGPGPVVFRPPSPPPSRLEDPRAPFREARSEARRFSSPGPRRAGTDAGLRQRLVHDADPPEADARKETAWSLCAGGGRVNAVQMPEDQELDLSQLYIGTKFATGAHSRLYHGVYRDETVAVKLITQPDNGDNDLLPAQLEREFRREVAFLSRLCHRNVLKLIGSSSSPPVFIIVTEYLSGGCLRAFLHRLEKRSLELKQLISIALDIARGMEYIHSQGIFHCDLKPENILFDGELCVKIADFGIACEEGRNDTLAGDPGTFRWMAPERIKGKKYGRKVDVYSFGLILWEMLTGNIPYGDMTPMQAAFSAVNKDLRPTIPPDCPPPLCALIEQCWASHPDKRPEFWQIVKVLEQFDLALARDGILDQVQNLTFQEQKNRLLHWIQKLKKPTYRGGLGQPVSKLL